MFLSVNSIPLTFHLYVSKLGCNSLLLRQSIDDFYSWNARVMRGGKKKKKREKNWEKNLLFRRCCKHKQCIINPVIPLIGIRVYNNFGIKVKKTRCFVTFVNTNNSIILIIPYLIEREYSYKLIQLSILYNFFFKYF